MHADLSNGAARSRDRFHPVTEYFAANRRGTITCPMAPRPTKPTFTGCTPFLRLDSPF